MKSSSTDPPTYVSTQLIGPYDDMPSNERQLISCSVHPKTKQRLFSLFLIRRGAQDKVMSRLLHLLDAWIVKHPQVYGLNATMREAVMNEILNEFAEMLENLTPKEIANKIESYSVEKIEHE